MNGGCDRGYTFKGEAIVDGAPIEFHIKPEGFTRKITVLYQSRCYNYEYSCYIDAIYDLACWVNGWKKAPFLAPPQKLGDTKLFPGWDVALPLFPDTVGKFSGRGKLLTLFDVLDADINPADKIRIILQPRNIDYRRFAEFKRKQLGLMLKMFDISHTAQSWASDDHKLQLSMISMLKDLLNEPKDPQ